MGYIRHHAIIVTSWNEKKVREARAEAILIGCDVSEVLASETNGYHSFVIPPDGSKEGWDASDAGDSRRDRFVEWLREQRHEDNSSPFSWAEVQYGDDNLDAKIVRGGDADEIETPVGP